MRGICVRKFEEQRIIFQNEIKLIEVKTKQLIMDEPAQIASIIININCNFM